MKALARLRQAALRPSLDQKGQTSIILILIIAVALVIYAASLNWGRITQFKTLTTIASNTAASNMASMVSSYGEQQLQVNLGGKPLYCKRTNLLVMIVILIIIIIVVIITWGASGAAAVPVFAIVIGTIAITLAVTALVLNLTVIQPGLTRLWNKMQENLATMEDQVVENGIMTGAQAIVTDSVQVLDHFDINTNGLWVDKFGRSNMGIEDTVSRFGYYYTMRLRQLQGVKIAEVDIFDTELKEMLFNNPYRKVGPSVVPLPPALPSGCDAGNPNSITCQLPDRFGLFDPRCAEGSRSPSPWCNPCCQPETDADGRGLRPESCAATAPGEVEPACRVNRPYPTNLPSDPHYLYQYDPFYEEDRNNIKAPTFVSFREMLGVDDENKYYKKDQTDLTNVQIIEAPSPTFRQEDATGFKTIPPVDPKKGIYPFFWNMSYFSFAAPPIANPALPKADNIVMATAEPDDCTFTSCPNRFKTDENMCALVKWETDPSNPKGFWWKSGSDQYCSSTYPYNDCGVANKAGSCTAGSWDGTAATIPVCGCEKGNPVEWREDPIDNLTYGLTQFIGWAKEITKSQRKDLYKTFIDWYPSAAYWIAPKCRPEWSCDADIPGDPINCSICNNELNDGLLIMWRDQMKNWVDLLDQWLFKENFAVTDAEGNNAFCFPPNQAAISPGEKSVYLKARAAAPVVLGTDGNPVVDRATALGTITDTTALPAVFGTLSDTIACLNLNKDSDTKFNVCETACSTATSRADVDITMAADNCLNLPRSIVPNFNTALDVPYLNAQQYQKCLDSTCTDPLDVPGNVLDVCEGLPAHIGAGTAVIQDCTGWPGTVLVPNNFYNYVKDQRDAQFTASTVCTSGAPQFLTNVQNSQSAANGLVATQAAELNNRFIYLTNLKAQAEAVRNTFMLGYSKFNDFLQPCSATGTLGDPADCGNCGSADDQTDVVNSLQACLNSTCIDGISGEVVNECKGLTDLEVLVPPSLANCAGWPGTTTAPNAFYEDVKRERDERLLMPALGARPAAKLMCARKDYTNREAKLSNFVIYGWQSLPGLNKPPYWHIIRVEAFAPRRCFNQCGTNAFPKVKTYTKMKFGFMGPDQFRCYELVRTEGTVITRVTRYDEEHTSSAFFANTQKIWSVQSHKGTPTGVEADSVANNLLAIGGTCLPPVAYLDASAVAPATKALLEKAFMINNIPTNDESLTGDGTAGTEKGRYISCLNAASALLERGIETTTCAAYYLDRTINHMSLKFIKCDAEKVKKAVGCAAGLQGGCPGK